MALPTETHKLGDLEYEITMLPFSKTRDAFARMMACFVPGFSGDIRTMVQQLATSDLAYFTDLFLPTTCVVMPDGKKPRLKDVAEIHFADKFEVYLAWLVTCIEVNFRSFLGDLAKGEGSLLASQLKSLPGLSGLFGALSPAKGSK